MKEQWRDVVGYKGFYQVSDLSRVRSVDRVVKHKRFGTMKRKGTLVCIRRKERYGYLAADLWREGIVKTVHVHRMVLEAWIGPRPDGCESCHGPNGHTDNSVSNLRWDTHKNNMRDGRKHGTGKGTHVRRSDGIEFVSLTVAAEETGCHRTAISGVCIGTRKTAGGYSWEYCND